MSLRTPLSKARGTGSAHEGAGHWLAQRATAVALVPLVLFFLASMVSLAGAPYEVARSYMSQPLVAVVFILLILAGFWHLRIGLGEVIADYIQKDGTRVFLLLGINFLSFALGAAAVLALVRLYVTG